MPPGAAGERAGKPGQDLRLRLEQRDPERPRGASGVRLLIPQQALAEGEGEFDAPGAAAGDHHLEPPRAVAGEEGSGNGLDLRDQPGDRPGGAGVLADSRQVEPGDRAADIERNEVVGERRAALEQDPPRRRGHADRGVEHHLGAGPAGERNHIDFQFRGPVLPRHEPRRHPGIDRHRGVQNDGDPRLRPRAHHHRPEHLDMGVSAADQQDARGGGKRRGKSCGGPPEYARTRRSRPMLPVGFRSAEIGRRRPVPSVTGRSPSAPGRALGGA